MAPIDPLDDPELVAALATLEGAPAPTLEPTPQDIWFAKVEEWAKEYNVQPGAHPSLAVGHLYLHFRLYAKELARPTLRLNQMWSRWFKEKGFVKGRTFPKGRDTRPILMGFSAAAYFRKWAYRHPPPPKGEYGDFDWKGAQHRKGEAPKPRQ